MRGELSKQLNEFINTVNDAIADAKANGVVATPELAREKLEALSALVSEYPDIAFTDDRVITTDNRNIFVKVYSPNPNKALPVVVYFHGGGHLCGSAEFRMSTIMTSRESSSTSANWYEFTRLKSTCRTGHAC